MATDAGNSYWYTQNTGGEGAFEISCGYRTTAEIVDGVVVGRTTEITWTPEGTTEADCEFAAFVEEGDDINANESYFAPPALTMEAQYAGCCDLLAIEPAEEYMTGFDVDDNGIAAYCFAVYANCADGCGTEVDGFSGFSFDAFGFGTLPR